MINAMTTKVCPRIPYARVASGLGAWSRDQVSRDQVSRV